MDAQGNKKKDGSFLGFIFKGVVPGIALAAAYLFVRAYGEVKGWW